MDSPNWFSESIERIAIDLADDDAPPLGAHTMSECIYCPRAGIITIDQRSEDIGCVGDEPPALGGLPWHDMDEIRERLQNLRNALKRPVGLAAFWVFVLLVIFSPLLSHLLSHGALTCAFLALIAGTPLYFYGRVIHRLLKQIAILHKRLRQAEAAAVAEPDWSLRVPQPVKWWSLIRAGFVSHELATAIKDRDLKLSGKPWRVLQRGAVHIPVMRLPATDADEDLRRQGRLRPPQRARLAAYAYLLHQVQRAHSDWVIVLFAGSDEGVAIPIDQAMLSTFIHGLEACRKLVSEYQANSELTPQPARETAPCTHCRFGEPSASNQPVVFRGATVAPFLTRALDGKPYHSPCGDRFRWVPPHTRAKRLGLVTE